MAEVVQKTSQENFAMYMVLDANVFKICKDACGNMCKCFNCGNPYGNNQKSSEPRMERKRKRHHNTPGSSLEFLHVKGEPLASVKWTDYGNHLLQQVANIVVGIEDNCVPDYESILSLFRQISTNKDLAFTQGY